MVVIAMTTVYFHSLNYQFLLPETWLSTYQAIYIPPSLLKLFN